MILKLVLSSLAASVVLAGAASAQTPAPAATTPAPDAGPRLTLAELHARYDDPAGRTMRIEGVDIHYKDEGHGPVLLMVHGSVSTLKTWDGVVARLKDRYRIIRYDVPPGGLSGPVSDAAAASVKPTDIAEQLLERLGVKRCTAVGVSSGGTLGVFLAAKRPDLVTRLVLSNAPSDPVDTSHLVFPPAFAAAQKEVARTHYQDQAFWNMYLDYFSGRPARITPAVRAQYYDFNRRTVEPHPIALVAQVADHAKALAAMGAVRAPTLLVWGAADPLLLAAAAETLKGYLTHAQVSVLLMPDVGHYLPLEVPDRFAAVLDDYLTNVAPEAPER